MSKEKFNDFFEMAKSKNDKKKKNKDSSVPFSKTDYAALTCAYMNDIDYEKEEVRTKNGQFIIEKSKPVLDFRQKMIGKVLTDNGIDKQQAEDAVKNYKYTKSQAEVMYPFEAENIEVFMRTGSTFRFPEKKDFTGSIRLKDVDGGTKISKNPKTDEDVKNVIKPHKTLIKKGSTPNYCKSRIK